MAMNVGSLRLQIGRGRTNRVRVSALQVENTILLPEEIAGDDVELIVAPETRVVRLAGLRRVLGAFAPTLRALPGQALPEALLIELPDLVEALGLVVDSAALHAPALELLGLLSSTNPAVERISLPSLSYLHQALIIAPKLGGLTLGSGCVDALLTIRAPRAAELHMDAACTIEPPRADEANATARLPARIHRPAGLRLALLEVVHWFTPRVTRDDEATYDADNIVFELRDGDDLADMARRAFTWFCGPGTRVHNVLVTELPVGDLPAWFVVPRAVILGAAPSGTLGTLGATWERIAAPGPDSANDWAARVRSLRALLEPPQR